jgi:hypothetical protein
MYALSGLLTCSHCGTRMTGVTIRNYSSYRCCDASHHGNCKGSCPQRSVREDWLLPRLIEKLKVEVEEIISHPPDELIHPRKNEQDKKQLQRDRDKLAKKIEMNVDELMNESDRETRQSISKRITAMRAELKQFDADLASKDDVGAKMGWSKEQIDAISNWWDEFEAVTTKLPILGANYEKYCKSLGLRLLQAEDCEQAAIKIDARRVRQIIHQKLQEAGVKVSLRWRETGKPCPRYKIDEKGILLEAGQVKVSDTLAS